MILAQSPRAHQQAKLGAQQPAIGRRGPLSCGVHASQGAEPGSVPGGMLGSGRGMVENE